MSNRTDLDRIEDEVTSVHKRVDEVITLVHQEIKDVRSDINKRHSEVMDRLGKVVDRRKPQDSPKNDNFGHTLTIIGLSITCFVLIVGGISASIKANSDRTSSHEGSEGHQHTTNMLSRNNSAIDYNAQAIVNVKDYVLKLSDEMNEALRERAEIRAKLDGKSEELKSMSGRIDRVDSSFVSTTSLDGRLNGIRKIYDNEIESVREAMRQLKAESIYKYYNEKLGGN